MCSRLLLLICLSRPFGHGFPRILRQGRAVLYSNSAANKLIRVFARKLIRDWYYSYKSNARSLQTANLRFLRLAAAVAQYVGERHSVLKTFSEDKIVDVRVSVLTLLKPSKRLHFHFFFEAFLSTCIRRVYLWMDKPQIDEVPGFQYIGVVHMLLSQILASQGHITSYSAFKVLFYIICQLSL